jgi:hypothetical protein
LYKIFLKKLLTKNAEGAIIENSGRAGSARPAIISYFCGFVKSFLQKKRRLFQAFFLTVKEQMFAI